MDRFLEGYKFFEKNASSLFASLDVARDMDLIDANNSYAQGVNNAIDILKNDLNSFKGVNTKVDQLKGDVFEFWHSDTFNIDAVMKESGSRTFVNRSHDFASVDISSNFGKDFGLKAYATGADSAKAQSVSIFQRFKEYQAKGHSDSLDKFLSDRNLDADSILSDPIYKGQIRVIPKDQLDDAVKTLERIIKSESIKNRGQVHRYQETLDMLTTKLEDGKGVESIPITKEEAEELARIAKEGNVDDNILEKYGVTREELLEYKGILESSIKAGLTAATITMVLKTAPEIYKAISYLIKEGEIQEDQFKKIGFAAVSGASEGFIRGTVAAALTSSCKAGLLGETLKEVNPSIIGAVTVITINVIKNSYAVTKDDMSRRQLANELIRDMYISTCSLVGGAISQSFIEIPVLGYMLGSFIGSIVGSFSYSIEQKAILSFCVDSGFTMFGLVEQDYVLPDDIIEQIGIETFEYDKIELDSFEPETFKFETFDFETFEPDNLGITFLRRGVIGVHKIGYM